MRLKSWGDLDGPIFIIIIIFKKKIFEVHKLISQKNLNLRKLAPQS